MTNVLKAGALVIVGVVVGLLLGGKVATESLGGVYSLTTQNFTTVATEDLSASDDVTITDRLTMGDSTGTTTMVLGKVCISLTSSTGTAFYAYFSSNGTLSTTTNSGCID